MCILIKHNANTVFTDELLLDFYSHNSDGFGAVYAEDGKLVVIKTLGKPDEIKAIYQETLKGRECIIHYRMKTHGDIDMDNCHPYKVTDDLWMAHNGILSMGNPIDPKRSDTWHFIEYILKPAMLHNPNIILDPDYQRYIEKMFGATNKFAFLHSSGEVVVLNYDAGVEHQGAWLSNTYAWSAHKHGHGRRAAYAGYNSRYDYYGDSYGTGYTLYPTTKHSSKSLSASSQYDTRGAGYGDYDDEYEVYDVNGKPKKFNIDKVVKAAHNCYRRGMHQLVDWVVAAPDKAEYLLIESYGEKEEGEMRVLVDSDPEEAASWLFDLFDGGNLDKDVAN